MPDPPQGSPAGSALAYDEADLRDAIGEEYIDRDYRPPAKPDRAQPGKETKRKTMPRSPAPATSNRAGLRPRFVVRSGPPPQAATPSTMLSGQCAIPSIR